jgi:hypothetical protein
MVPVWIAGTSLAVTKGIHRDDDGMPRLIRRMPDVVVNAGFVMRNLRYARAIVVRHRRPDL